MSQSNTQKALGTHARNYKELYNSVKWQNDMMDNQQAKMRDMYSTDQQRVKYLLVDMSWYTYLNFILWCIFYILCLVVIYYTFYGKERGFSITIKIIIVFAFLIFPMVCTSMAPGHLSVEKSYYLSLPLNILLII